MSKSSLIVEVLHANDVPRDRLKKNDPYVVVFLKVFLSSLLKETIFLNLF